MLSTIAKFIFGGILSNEQDESLQCETTEVNDWLLVNMPNQPGNNEETKEEADMDDVLEDLHFLLASDSTCDNSFSDVISTSMLYEQPISKSVATQASFLVEECLQDFQVFPESMYLGQSFFYPSEFSLITSQYFGNPEFEELFHPDQSMLIIENKKDRTSRPKTVVVLSRDVKIQNHPDKRICHPAASSRNYVNHRSPVLPPRTALLEQIKELKPMQQAIEYDLKKQVSKSQLHRQNKNFIYETSAKTNRRKNLWRNHSGANNNRKCC